MVTNRNTVMGMLLGALLASLALGDSPIKSVTATSDTTVRIKPCQWVFVLLDVVIDSGGAERKIRRVPPEVTARVVVNGKEYPTLMENMNAVAGFMLDKSTVQCKGDGTTGFRVLVMLYINAPERVFLFGEPGEYEIVLADTVKVNVIVEEPSPEEQEIAAQMKDLGVQWAFFLAAPTARQHAVPMLPHAERMLAEYPKSAYARELSLAVGLSKFVTEEPAPSADLQTRARNRAELRRYFEPYCESPIRSMVDAAAAYYLAWIELAQVRADPEGRNEATATARRKAKTLLEKVRDSPYSLRQRSSAVRMLRDLEE